MSGAAPLIRSTVADVDLDAVVANLGSVRKRSAAAVFAVVKADAYGHGVEAISLTLAEAGVEMLAVGTVEEALLLRKVGVRAPILVLLGATDRAEADAAIAAGCAVSAWDLAGAHRLAEAARAAGTTAAVHFKVDTGFTRLGAPLDIALARWKEIGAVPGLRIEGAYTHLATADEPDEATARAQLAAFDDFVRAIGDAPRWVHALASASVAALGASTRTNAVRVGLALYGVDAAAHLRGKMALRAALSWRTAVHRVAEVRAGTGVGYGHAYRMPRDGRIATLPVGYGDGLPRTASPRGGVLIGGRFAGIVGRVSMDLVTVDVSEIAGVREGDEAVLVGAQGPREQSVIALADAAGTVSYEILTGIRARVPRRYLRGGRVVATKTLRDGFSWS